MLSLTALVWGIAAVVGVVADFRPGSSFLMLCANIGFDVLGTSLGIIAAVRAHQKGSKAAIAGTILCFFCGLIMMIKLTVSSGMQ